MKLKGNLSKILISLKLKETQLAGFPYFFNKMLGNCPLSLGEEKGCHVVVMEVMVVMIMMMIAATFTEHLLCVRHCAMKSRLTNTGQKH